jgi:acyl-CoA reductase-like NAD-dependent aldehyde dehydrogenase
MATKLDLTVSGPIRLAAINFAYPTQKFPGNIINNSFVPTAEKRHSTNPANGEALYDVPVATQKDVDEAVKCAKAAFKTWSKTTFKERSELMLAFADAIEENREDLEVLQVKEQGKPLGLAKTEFDMAIMWLRTFATMEVSLIFCRLFC